MRNLTCIIRCLLSSPPKANRNRPFWTSNNNTTTTSICDENQTSKWSDFQFQLVKISTNSFSTILNKSESIHIHTSNMEIIDDLIYYYYRRAEEKTPRPPKGTFTQLIHFGWWWALFWIICTKSLKGDTSRETFCHFVIKTLRIFPKKKSSFTNNPLRSK
jgi:hypothetical protein